MPGESLANSDTASVTPEMIAQAFNNQPIVSAMEDDRFCHGCGYNLRGQAARRETMTRVLMVRCPECGEFEPANEPRPWTGRATKFIVGAFVMICLAAVLVAMLVQTIGTFIVYAVVYENWGRSYRGPDANFLAVAAIVLGCIGAGALGGGLCMLAMACIPRWRRVGYLVLNAAWPILPATFVAAMIGIFDTRKLDMALVVAISLGFAAFIGGLMAWSLGRWPARWFVSLVLSPSWRAYLGYLWTVDGLDVPATDHAELRVFKTQASEIKAQAGSSPPSL